VDAQASHILGSFLTYYYCERGYNMLSQCLSRFAELYESQGRNVEFIDDKYWVNYGRMIVPIGPAYINYAVSEDKAQQLIKKFPKALLLRYTEGFLSQSDSENWYSVICDEFIDLNKAKHENRRQIKRGLENFEVRQVDSNFIAENGYEVYLAAFSKYQNIIKPIKESRFISIINTTKDYTDIYHFWAVLNKGKLIAYAVVALFTNEVAEISVLKLRPDYHKLYPCNALLYTITKHYLVDLSMRYIDAGFKNIYHKTNIHEYLIKRHSFKKEFLNIGIIYNRILSSFLKLTYPISGVLGKASCKLEAIYQLEKIRRNGSARSNFAY
jgi:hypothetical protein